MKVLKVAAIVVGVAALAITGVGLAGGFTLAEAFAGATSIIGGTLGISAALATALVTGALILDASMLAGALLPKPTSGGQQTKWKADPYAGLPYVMGRTLTSGNIVYRRGHGSSNKYQTFVTVLSIGPIALFEAAFADKLAITFDGAGNATGQFHNQIYEKRQLGALPEAAALVPPIDSPPGWTTAHKLSGLAAIMNSYVYDGQSKSGLTYVPQPSWIVQGVKVYDPRQDSTYPGGSGACRFGIESTYVYSENPHLHALTWCIGRFQNGVRVAGIGATAAQIDIATFVDGANLDDARGWKLGGTVYTRPDTRWNALVAMLQAGGAQPVLTGGRIASINRAPRVSLDTITTADIVGPANFGATQPRRSRINSVIPQYRSEAHDWEMVSASAAQVASFITLDGDERTREIAYPLVQQVNQAAQLATYDIYDSREAGPGTVPLKPRFLNYRLGDALTFEPEDGLSIKVLAMGRQLDPQSGTVTFTLRGETDAKHSYALGQTGTAPPVASLTYDNTVAAPAVGDWALSGTALTASGASIPALVLTGACANASADAVVVDYRVYSAGLGSENNWIGATSEAATLTRKEITSVTPGTQYQVSVRYRVRGVTGDRQIYGPVTAGALAAPSSFVLNSTNCTRVGDKVTKTSGTGGAWDASVYSQQGWVNGAALTFTPAQTNLALMMGLNSDPATDSNWSSIDYAWYLRSDGQAEIRESGGTSPIAAFAYAATDVFSVQYDGANVRYYVNGTVKRTVAAAANLVLYLDSSFNGTNAAVTINGFGPQGAAGTNGAPGSPGAPGSDGISPVLAIASPTSLDIATSAAGVPNLGELPKSVTLSVVQGITDLSNDPATTFSLTAPSGFSGSLGGTNGKVLSVTAMSADSAIATVTISRSGTPVATVVIPIQKQKAGAAASSAVDYGVVAPSNTTYGAVCGGPITVLSGYDGSITLGVNVFYLPTSGTGRRVYGKLQYRTSTDGTFSGSWTDVAAETPGTPADSSTEGDLSMIETLSHSGSPLFYQVQLLLRYNTAFAFSTFSGSLEEYWTP